jgi:adenylate kinase
MRYRTILLFGAPGSGKGTQGRILGMIPGFHHCSCGDVFRRLRPETELGRVFLQYSSAGQLVPDEFTVRLWRENLEAETQAGRYRPETDTLVLDGIPRNPTQARMLQEALDVVVVFSLTCAEHGKLIERMQRRALKENRLDDANLDVIRKRFETYERETRQMLDCYPPRLLHRIDAAQTPIRVLRDILTVVDSLENGE